jgi:hypothetical protein
MIKLQPFSILPTTALILIFHTYPFKAFSHASRTATTMGLLTWNVPSSHTKEAETMNFCIVPLIVRVNGSFCPRDVNDRRTGFTLILIPSGVVTTALYVEFGDPTLVTVR